MMMVQGAYKRQSGTDSDYESSLRTHHHPAWSIFNPAARLDKRLLLRLDVYGNANKIVPIQGCPIR